MKIQTKILWEALLQLKPFVESKSQFHFLSCAKIVTGDKMEITTTDLNQTSSRTLDFNGDADVFCVNFSSMMWSLGEADETMFVRDGQNLVVKCGKKTSRISLIDPADFPESPAAKDFKSIGVNCDDLATGIKAVHGFEHKERDPLTNIGLRGSPKLLECFAADGANLAHYELPSICASFDVLLPADFAGSLAEALTRKDAVLKLSERHALVTWDGGFYVCKLGEGQFYSTSNFTDRKMPRLGKLATAPLIRECEACIALTNPDRAPAINLDFTKGGLSTGFGGTNENEIPFESEQAYKCTVNAKSEKLCLTAIGDTCELFADDRMTKMVNGELSIYSTLMLAP